MSVPFRSILIYGMGMMGASLALALRASGYTGRLSGVVRSEESERYIRANAMCDTVYRVGSKEELHSLPLADYDCIVFGLPVRSFLAALVDFPPFDGVVTDMSSTRSAVEEAARRRPDLRFVGSHPMCGSEDAGPSAAKPSLFSGKLCIITDDGRNASDRESVIAIWEAVGMKSYCMDAKSHDEVVAYLSHAPHFLSGLIADWAAADPKVERHTKASPLPISGGGFRDMVRIAGSNPSMWYDILDTNRDAVLDALRAYRERLDELIDRFEANDEAEIKRWLVDARRARNRLCGYPEES